jgi:hypothetical protein
MFLTYILYKLDEFLNLINRSYTFINSQPKLEFFEIFLALKYSRHLNAKLSNRLLLLD